MIKRLPRVFHIITGLSVGGAERTLYVLLLGGLAQRFENQVVSLSDQGAFGSRIHQLGVQVSALGMRRAFPSPRSIAKLRQIARRFQPDIIQGWMYHGNVMASLVRSLLPNRPALAWNVRQSLYDLKREKLLTQWVIRASRRLSSGPEALLYNSRVSRQQHVAFGFSDSSSFVIPNGFDLQQWCSSEVKRRAIREELSIPAEATVVGHVARLHPVKDHATFLRAAASVVARNENVHFLLSGRGVVAENPSLVSMVPRTARANIHFLGERNDVPDLMRAMDIFCSSALGEAFPNALGEAMATELPCVATDVGDSRSIVGDTGIVEPPRDEEALAAGLMRLLSMTTGERRALGKAARARVEANYALPVVVERYAEIYRDLMERRGNH